MTIRLTNHDCDAAVGRPFGDIGAQGASSKGGCQAIRLTSHLAADATKSQARLRSLGRYHIPAVIIDILETDLRMSEIG